MRDVFIAGEDEATRAVIVRLIKDYAPNLHILRELPARGSQVKAKIPNFNALARTIPVILLTDLDDDPCGLLGNDYDETIFTLKNVRKSDRISPDYIARRKFCKDFENYQPMFETLRQDLESGRRKLAVYIGICIGLDNIITLNNAHCVLVLFEEHMLGSGKSQLLCLNEVCCSLKIADKHRSCTA